MNFENSGVSCFVPRLEDVRSNYIKEQYALDVALICAAVGISSSSSIVSSTIIKYSSSSRMLLFPALIQSQAIKIYSQIPIPPELFSSLYLSFP